MSKSYFHSAKEVYFAVVKVVKSIYETELRENFSVASAAAGAIW